MPLTLVGLGRLELPTSSLSDLFASGAGLLVPRSKATLKLLVSDPWQLWFPARSGTDVARGYGVTRGRCRAVAAKRQPRRSVRTAGRPGTS